MLTKRNGDAAARKSPSNRQSADDFGSMVTAPAAENCQCSEANGCRLKRERPPTSG